MQQGKNSDLLQRTLGELSKKASQLIVQLKCLYTNAYSIGNKQEELEAMVQLEKYDLSWKYGRKNQTTEYYVWGSLCTLRTR